MKKKYTSVYQFKIALQNIRPPIWRRIQVPETYTFWDLHVAVQDAMGWEDYHLHQFNVIDPSTGMKMEIGIPEETYGKYGHTISETKAKIADYFTTANKKAQYVYDFGDDWEHKIELEKILPRDKSVQYPVCIKGKRACPPEDCGGCWGYEDLLEIIKDPDHDEYEEMVEWIGEEFDPEYFNPEEVYFDDPDKRLKMAF